MTEPILGDRYQLVTRVGSGGMAEVWEANDLSLGRRVAVKLLHPHLADEPSVLARFRSEAQAAARLTHPGIVAIYDTVTTERTDAIVMELVEGRDLRSVLDERRTLTATDAVEVAIQVAQALGHAHHHGIVHRDVKPANVLVRPDRRVKLSDFGIAKALDDSTFTDTGALVGTVKYLAPEQIQGNLVDGRTDLYSLTIVLYEMLCGDVPFSATDLIGAMDRMKRPAPRALATRRDISPELDDFIAKGLERNPADRFADARSYVAALKQVQRPDATAVLQPQAAPAPAPAPQPSVKPSIPMRVPAADPAPAAPPRPSRARLVWPAIATLLMIAAGVTIWMLLSPLRDSASDAVDTSDGDTTITTTSTEPPTDDTSATEDEDTADSGDTTDTGSDGTDGSAVDPDADAVESTSSSSTTSTTSTTTAPLPDPPVVDGVKISAFDPGGDDGLEHSDITNRAYDGDPATFWYTQRYNSRLFGGLKGGVGLIIEFEEPRTFSQLNVAASNPDWSARVYAASFAGSTLEDWGDPVRFFENNEATASLGLPQITAQALLLWITDLGEPVDAVDDEGVRLEVFEVSVS